MRDTLIPPSSFLGSDTELIFYLENEREEETLTAQPNVRDKRRYHKMRWQGRVGRTLLALAGICIHRAALCRAADHDRDRSRKWREAGSDQSRRATGIFASTRAALERTRTHLENDELETHWMPQAPLSDRRLDPGYHLLREFH